ncbi:MAG: FtsW/RodA/SpoVE family cell cycle protein, partial [Sulfurovum sp.]|nr:FtsW/RodA/SpoVE family cell cycle protein [Sulfurovum sp.]
MIDKPLLIAVVMLLTLSLVMDYSLSVYTVQHFGYSDFHFLMRQGAAVLLSLTVIVFLSKFNPDTWFVWIGWALFVVFFLLMATMQALPASLVSAVGGAKRWIHIGSISIAPVEFFKVGFIFFLSWSFTRKFKQKEKMGFQ